ncbi:MAG: DNA helicase RecQ [Elusimicrobia bacterium]|nr:DNA helicase RecQ [Elusimicrobiota bacterium]
MNKLEVLNSYWGYDAFLPFQEKAIDSILDDHDTLTVLPTGGGKSICFQLPALLKEGMAVIISPLISLMKDQVDSLHDLGISARYLNSSLEFGEQKKIVAEVRASRVKLLYLAPERLALEQTKSLLQSVSLSYFVVDEAHCISHWGHNFREDYRNLQVIKEAFKNIAVHAFTATATPEVRADIVKQLKLVEPHLYLGAIDRPNLAYRVKTRESNYLTHIAEILNTYKDEAGIIYCIRRKDVDELSQRLTDLGYKNLPYHAGLNDEIRTRNQNAFSQEKINIMVATVAFGMGIDRSNIRYIIHLGMPKSIEHYQQETGRAGRDGLNSACYLFYQGGDYRTWEYLVREAVDRETLLKKLKEMYNYCSYPECRHKYLSNYFGQELPTDNCGACDYCLNELEMIKNPAEVSRKIISAVREVNERFGADHIVNILTANENENVTRWRHNKITSFGIMRSEKKTTIRYAIEQLVGQGYLARELEHYTLSVTAKGSALQRGEWIPKLASPIMIRKIARKEKKEAYRGAETSNNYDQAVFEKLRNKRRELAERKKTPAYIIFSDKSLWDMAHKKPVTLAAFQHVYGVGEQKLEQYGEEFVSLIKQVTSG